MEDKSTDESEERAPSFVFTFDNDTDSSLDGKEEIVMECDVEPKAEDPADAPTLSAEPEIQDGRDRRTAADREEEEEEGQHQGREEEGDNSEEESIEDTEEEEEEEEEEEDESDIVEGGVLYTLLSLFCKPRIEREAALLIDIFISLSFTIMPSWIGIAAAVGYFLLRDSFRIGTLVSNVSYGRSIYGIEIVRMSDGKRAGRRACMLRNLLLLVPVLNIIDIYHFATRGQRLTDDWLGTKVIAESEKQEGDNN